MRLTLTRGEKCTSSMNPLFNVYGTTLIIYQNGNLLKEQQLMTMKRE